jgi:hypothetical protein
MGTSPDPSKQREHCQRHAAAILEQAKRMRAAAERLEAYAEEWPPRVANEIIVQLLFGISERSKALAPLIDCIETDLCFVRFGQTTPEAANDGE